MNEAAAEHDLDLAVIGGGVAGIAVARAMRAARPDWSTSIFERTKRTGGRLRSMRIEGLDHPIELGGMRFLTSHPRVARIVGELGLDTRIFDPNAGAPERLHLRGNLVVGADDPSAGLGYDLRPDQRGNSAAALAGVAYERIVPGFEELAHDGYARRRATGRLFDRPVIDWTIGDALDAVLGREARRFVRDAFGYDSGPRMMNAADHVEFVFNGGDPKARAVVPIDGMDRIPGGLAAQFEETGGLIHLEHELAALQVEDGGVSLHFANGASIRAAKVVLAMPVPALQRLAAGSSVLRGPTFDRVVRSVDPIPAMKLYLWYERPWWRPAVPGIRSTTDLPIRKVFYFDGKPGSHAALLGMYTDALDVLPWLDLYEGAPAGAPAPDAMLREVQRHLATIHPDVSDVPWPSGSALMYWGADPHETGWHFWRAGENSDEIVELAPQPEPTLPIYLANEAFSRRQSWVEGALEAAEAAVERLLRRDTVGPARSG